MSNATLEKRGPDGPNTQIERHRNAEPWQDAEWQRLWLAVERHSWRSLALIPAGGGASADFTLTIAMTLSRTGMVHLGTPLQVADATSVSLSQLTAFTGEVNRVTNTGQRLIVALPAVGSSAVTAAIAQAVDAAVMCVLAEKMTSGDAKKTIRLVGRARFIGSAIFYPHGSPDGYRAGST